MFDEMYIVVIWFCIVLGLATITHQLLRWAGVLVASQGAMLLIGAFTFTIVLRNDFTEITGIFVSILVCGALGLVHQYILYVVGPLLFVLLCIAGDVFLAEAWLAVPSVTGGSGGLILPEQHIGIALISSMICVVIAMITRILSGGQKTYSWATIRTHGWHAGLFGVNDRRSFAMLFGVYGIITGIGGSGMAACTGYVAPSGLHLPFTMAVVMIAAATPSSSIVTLVTLSGLYSSIRTVLRQTVVASPVTAVCFEVFFPIVLILFVCLRVFNKKRVLDR